MLTTILFYNWKLLNEKSKSRDGRLNMLKNMFEKLQYNTKLLCTKEFSVTYKSAIFEKRISCERWRRDRKGWKNWYYFRETWILLGWHISLIPIDLIHRTKSPFLLFSLWFSIWLARSHAQLSEKLSLERTYKPPSHGVDVNFIKHCVLFSRNRFAIGAIIGHKRDTKSSCQL